MLKPVKEDGKYLSVGMQIMTSADPYWNELSLSDFKVSREDPIGTTLGMQCST